MVDLGTIGGADYSDSVAFSVNDAGQVVGTSYTGMAGGYNRAFSWTEKGGMVNLGTPDVGVFAYAQASSVNNAGQVVGFAVLAGAGFDNGQAFSWTEKGGIVPLGTLGGDVSSSAAVNDKGQAVGYSTTAGDAETHAALWQLTHGND